jgi:hypothetical protein
MRIGIDISQTAYQNTGVGNYLSNLVANLLKEDKTNEYILFFSSLRRNPPGKILKAIEANPRSIIVYSKLPPTALNLMWNSMHIMPIETFIGKVDFFISSDWAEPPSRAKKATIIYDLIVYKNPEETHNETEFKLSKLNISSNIVATQKRKLEWVKRESDIIFTISKSGKKDVEEILGIDSNKVKVIYPGF